MKNFNYQDKENVVEFNHQNINVISREDEELATNIHEAVETEEDTLMDENQLNSATVLTDENLFEKNLDKNVNSQNAENVVDELNYQIDSGEDNKLNQNTTLHKNLDLNSTKEDVSMDENQENVKSDPVYENDAVPSNDKGIFKTTLMRGGETSATSERNANSGIIGTFPVLGDTKDGFVMLGDLNVRGEIDSVEGVEAKLTAAKREGIKNIVLPEVMRQYIMNLNENYRMGLIFHFVNDMFEAVKIIFNEFN
uniref:Lon proteolytic domain-containing protein n=1 Tax=Meloidogyne hapla TaxID=6305 RepID=A0A1I8BJL1_MELHA